MVLNPDQTHVDQLTFYASHSPYSDPGQYGDLLENLPRDFAAISRVAQGLIYHYMAGVYIHGYQPPQDRIPEIDTRYMERIIARMLERDNRPLNEAREFANRFVGCCRDFSLLTCATLRQHGIPARLRYGFANYFVAGYWIDHVIVEAWNLERWQRFDPQVTDGSTMLDLTDAEFVTGGRAWHMWRHEGVDPAHFGLGPGMPELSGGWFIRSRLLLDVAALNKQELLCWDQWGLSSSQEDRLGADEENLLERVATLSAEGDMTTLQSLTTVGDVMRVPTRITCYSPAVGPHEVTISSGK